MGDALSALGGLALIVGLFVAYAIQRRNERAKKNPPPAPAVLPPVAAPPTTADSAAPMRQSRSPNWGAPILLCALLFGAATHRQNFWGYLWQAIFLAFVAVGAYTTFSATDFAAEQKRDPELTRTMHVVMTGVPYVLFPMIGWTMVVPLGINAGAIVPGLAWVPLIVIGLVLAAVERARSSGIR